jgi:hypothetical protein
MKEICIPVSHFLDDEIAEVTVKIGDREENYHFRVESFPWKSEAHTHESEDEYLTKSLKRIYKLKQAIESYDRQWELIQIFTPDEHATHIQVLYRKKKEYKQQSNQLIS